MIHIDKFFCHIIFFASFSLRVCFLSLCFPLYFIICLFLYYYPYFLVLNIIISLFSLWVCLPRSLYVPHFTCFYILMCFCHFLILYLTFFSLLFYAPFSLIISVRFLLISCVFLIVFLSFSYLSFDLPQLMFGENRQGLITGRVLIQLKQNVVHYYK